MLSSGTEKYSLLTGCPLAPVPFIAIATQRYLGQPRYSPQFIGEEMDDSVMILAHCGEMRHNGIEPVLEAGGRNASYGRSAMLTRRGQVRIDTCCVID